MKSEYRLRIEGLNLHHLLSYFESNEFTLSGLVRPDAHTLEVTLSGRDYKKFKKCPLAKAFKVTLLSTRGMSSLARLAAGKIGLFLGVIFATMACFYFTNRVYSVEIAPPSGHECQNQESCIFTPENLAKLREELRQNGVFEGASLNSLPSNRALERDLMLAFPQISGVKMEVKGVKVVLQVLEGRLPVKYTTSDLVASRPGVVITTEVSSGKLKVKSGDIVLAGDTLVEAEGDLPVRATIVLRTFYHEATIYNENQVRYRRTGRHQTATTLSVFGLSSTPKACTFKLYESEESCRYVFYNLFLPLVQRTTTFYELEAVETNVPFSEARTELEARLALETRQQLSPLAEEKNITFATLSDGSRHRLDCYIEAYLTEKK